jgi:hypothetical protein
MNSEQRIRYLASSRRQLRQELDEMGYGQPPQPAMPERVESKETTGFIVALATMAALFVGLYVSGLVA